MKYTINLLLLILLFSLSVSAKENPNFLKYSNDQWVDSIMKKLTIDQKIGQLFMIQAYSSKKGQNTEELIQMIRKYEVGGIIFMKGGPVAQANISNRFQQASKIPLLVAIDAENGLGFRLDSTLNYPVQMALGAISNDSLIYKMGYEIGKQCRMTGIHMNMAPVSDINIKPENPIINYRSFGENKKQVAHKSWLYAHGMQDANVLATAKHFPGHGDTQTDSHLCLPSIEQTKDELDSLELVPFKYLIEQGIGAIMTGHLQVPALEPNHKIPATLSKRIIDKKLKKDLQFSGLVITDAMNMKGVSNLYSSAESAVKALKAGNDMIEIVPRLDKAIAAVKQAVAKGLLTEAEINEKCRKILSVKKWLDLDKHRLVETQNLYQNLTKNEYRLTKRLLQEQSMTVLLNQQNLIPLQRLDTLKIASVMIGTEQTSPFQTMLGNYASIDHFNIGKTPTEAESNQLLNQLNSYNLLIIGINKMGLYPSKRFGISDEQISLIEKLKNRTSVICFFGNPYSLPNFSSFPQTKSLVVAYQDDQDTQELAAQLIFGAIGTNGKLPVSINEQFPINTGIEIKPIKRLKYTLPEEVGINSVFLKSKIDSLAESGIYQKAYPGCIVLIAKEGKVIFQSGYGNYTYDQVMPVTPESVYDLASITGITASLPLIMKLYDEKKIDLNSPIASYYHELSKTNKDGLTFRDLLTHQGRLQSNLPLWLEKGSGEKLKKGLFRDQPTEKYQTRVSSKLYTRTDFKNQLIKDILKSPLRTKKEFCYSDLGFCLIPSITESLTTIDFQDNLNHHFYAPLGATTLGFKPYERIPVQQIVPTEDDQFFRKELLQGFVQDELASLTGGVAGNAGLFGTANDLAKFMQMYLNSGYYGGKQYIYGETINEFTRLQFPETGSHQALGFDKPHLSASEGKNTFPAADASPASYGQSGFTGTFVWADPQNQTLFIFLSNRINPSRTNTRLNDLSIVEKMHQTVYDAIRKGSK